MCHDFFHSKKLALKAFGVKTVITFPPENVVIFQMESPLWSLLAVKVFKGAMLLYFDLFRGVVQNYFFFQGNYRKV